MSDNDTIVKGSGTKHLLSAGERKRKLAIRQEIFILGYIKSQIHRVHLPFKSP
jgi:hypothetical protein